MSSRKGKQSDVLSTVVIHGDDVEDEEEEEEMDSSLLPPLLQRLPKDFDDAAGYDEEEDEEESDLSSSGISGTFIVKRDLHSPSPRRPLRSPFLDFNRSSPRASSEPDDAYSTFVRKSGREGGGFGSPFMSEAFESMKKAAAAEGDEGRQNEPPQHLKRRPSITSVTESVNREDPTTKYELLHELGYSSSSSSSSSSCLLLGIIGSKVFC